MFCSKCGKESTSEAKFCSQCSSPMGHNAAAPTQGEFAESQVIIKCLNCSHIGAPLNNRNSIIQVFAWLLLPFMPLYTILYYALTDKHKCSKCNSTLIGIRDETGNFIRPKKNVVFLMILFPIGIIVMGLFAAVTLPLLYESRAEGEDSSIRSAINNVQASAEIFYNENDSSYEGFCEIYRQTKGGSSLQKIIVNNSTLSTPTCSDNFDSYVIVSPLNSGRYYCVDNLGYSAEIDTPVGTQTSCMGSPAEATGAAVESPVVTDANEERCKVAGEKFDYEINKIADGRIAPKIEYNSADGTCLYRGGSTIGNQFNMQIWDLYSNNMLYTYTESEGKPLSCTDSIFVKECVPSLEAFNSIESKLFGS